MSNSTEVLYRLIGGAKQLCSEFTFTISPAPTLPARAGFIELKAGGVITVSPGYVWDGASGPTVDTSDSICAALGHDVMYELMDLGILSTREYKAVADRWFYDRLIDDGMLQFRAYAWYKAVNIFGRPGMSDNTIRRAPKPFPPKPTEVYSPIPGYTVRR